MCGVVVVCAGVGVRCYGVCMALCGYGVRCYGVGRTYGVRMVSVCVRCVCRYIDVVSI